MRRIVQGVSFRSGRSIVYGARVGPDGQNLDGGGFPIHDDHPAVAWHDGTYLVVLARVVDDGSWPGEVSDIFAVRVDPAGSVLDPSPLPISTAPGQQHHPGVAFNGQFLVTWTDRRNATGPNDPGSEVYGAMVGPDVTVGAELLIGTTDAYSGDPAVAPIPGDDDFAAAYGRYLPEEPYGTIRAFLRRVSPK